MKLSKKIRIGLVVIITLSVLLYLFIIYSSNIKEADFLSVNWSLIAAAAGLVLLGYIIRIWRFSYLLKKVGIFMNKRDTFLVFLSGFSMLISPGRIGEIIRPYLMKQKHGIEISKTLPLVIVERLSDFLGVSLLALIFIYSFLSSLYLIAALVIVGILLILFFKSKRVFNFVIEKSSKTKWLKKFSVSTHVFKSNLDSLMKRKILAICITISMIAWGLEGLGLWMVVKALSYSINLGSAIFTFSLSSLLGVISMIPGGLGITEGGIIFLLNKYLPLNISAFASLLTRGLTIWFGLIIGVICLWILEYFIKKDEKHEKSVVAK